MPTQQHPLTILGDSLLKLSDLLSQREEQKKRGARDAVAQELDDEYKRGLINTQKIGIEKAKLADIESRQNIARKAAAETAFLKFTDLVDKNKGQGEYSPRKSAVESGALSFNDILGNRFQPYFDEEDKTKESAMKEAEYQRTKQDALDQRNRDYAYRTEEREDEQAWKDKARYEEYANKIESTKTSPHSNFTKEDENKDVIGSALIDLKKTYDDVSGKTMLGTGPVSGRINKLNVFSDKVAAFETAKQMTASQIVKSFQGARPSDFDMSMWMKAIGGLEDNPKRFDARLDVVKTMITDDVKKYNQYMDAYKRDGMNEYEASKKALKNLRLYNYDNEKGEYETRQDSSQKKTDQSQEEQWFDLGNGIKVRKKY